MFLKKREGVDRDNVQSYFIETRKAFIDAPCNDTEAEMFAGAECVFAKVAAANVPPLKFEQRCLKRGPDGIHKISSSDQRADTGAGA